MSDKNSQSSMFPDSTETGNRQNTVKGGRSSGNLSKGICSSSNLSSKFVKSNLLQSKCFQSKLNSIIETNKQSVLMDK